MNRMQVIENNLCLVFAFIIINMQITLCIMPIYIITSIWVLAGKHVNLVDYRTSNCIFEINTIYRALYWCVSLIEIYYYVLLND